MLLLNLIPNPSSGPGKACASLPAHPVSCRHLVTERALEQRLWFCQLTCLYFAHRLSHSPICHLRFSNCKMIEKYLCSLHIWLNPIQGYTVLYLPWAVKWCGGCRISMGEFLSFQIPKKGQEMSVENSELWRNWLDKRNMKYLGLLSPRRGKKREWPITQRRKAYVHPILFF